MELTLKEQMLKIINNDIENVVQEMKHLDKQYLEKQKELRQLKKSKDVVVAMIEKDKTSSKESVNE